MDGAPRDPLRCGHRRGQVRPCGLRAGGAQRRRAPQEHAHSGDGRRLCPAGGVVGHLGRRRPRPAADRAGIDRQPRGLLAGWARASSVPDETVQALRTLPRPRRALVASQSAARQRLHDELVPVFPELVSHLPKHADLGALPVLHLLSRYSSAQALAQVPLDELQQVLEEVSDCHWGRAQAQALQDLAQHSAASTRAVAARAVVVRTLALHLLDLQARVSELDGAPADLLRSDPPRQQLQGQVPGLGPTWTATIRAELGDVSRFSRLDQVVAYAGLEPRTHDSGRFAGQRRLSKRGPGALRHDIYMATQVSVLCRPEWRAHYQRLLDRGRAKKEALTILARKLLKVLYHLLRTGASYDPARIFPAPLAGQA